MCQNFIEGADAVGLGFPQNGRSTRVPTPTSRTGKASDYGADQACRLWRGALQCGIKIRHKGLRALHERDSPARVPAGMVPRLRRILFRLQEASNPRSADSPGFRLHPLKGDRAGQ